MNCKVMIVDDEPIVCEGLRMFDWQRFGCELTGEAADGVEALERLDSIRPDIIISDIKMPGMDGIEFSRLARQAFPGTQIILLTGYADFTYAQQALKLGIHDYLLKPFSFEDIEKALTSCLHAIRQERREMLTRQQITEQLRAMAPFLTKQVFQDLLDGNITRDSDKLSVCRINPAKYIVFSTQCDVEGKESYNLALYSLLNEAVADMEREFYLAQGTDVISCVLCFKEERSDDYCTQAAVHFCRMFQTLAKERFGFTISIGISLPDRDIFQLKQLRKQSIRALNYRYILGGSFVMRYSDVVPDAQQAIVDLTSHRKSIEKCLLQRTPDPLDTILRELIHTLARASGGNFDLIKENTLNLLLRTFHFAAHEVPGATAELPYSEIEILISSESLESFTHHAAALLKKLAAPTQPPLTITAKVQTYLQQNLDQDLSLEALSNHLGYSTSYLSRLIKKDTGKTFTELLQDNRITRAKQLLRDTDLKINRLANQVGYQDHSYFIQTFKKNTGLTPTEYRHLTRLENSHP